MKTKFFVLFILAALLAAVLPAAAVSVNGSCVDATVNGLPGAICRFMNNDGLMQVVESVDAPDGSSFAVHSTYYDEDGDPALSSNGCHESFTEWDMENHLILRTLCLGTDGERANNKSGYAEVIREYDGNETMTRYIDADGNPCFNAYGIAQVHTICNEENTECDSFYLDLDGNRITDNEGRAYYHSVYDSEGIETSCIHYDSDGNALD